MKFSTFLTYAGYPSCFKLEVMPKTRFWHSAVPIQQKKIFLDRYTNLPILAVDIPDREEIELHALQSVLDQTCQSNQNLTEAQKSLVFWHKN